VAKATTLTEAGIKRLPAAPQGQRNDKPDRLAPGLFLRVNDKGRKSWMVHFRVNGKQGKLALGTWPTMKIGEARDKARWARDQAKAGIHPRTALEAEEAARRRESGEIFSAVAQLYIEAAKAGKLLGARKRPVTLDTAKGRESRLQRLILPDLGDRPLKELTAAEVSEFLAKIEAVEGPVDRCLQDIRLIYKFSAARGFYHGLEPTSGIRNRQAPEKKSRALDDYELRAMWLAAGEYGYPFGPAIKLLMLTGQRRDEIGEAKWSDLDLERRLLNIPASRNKNRKGNHEVLLSESAISILNDARKICEVHRLKSDFVFTNTGKTPVSGWSKAGPIVDRYIRIKLAELSDEEKKALFFKGRTSADMRKRKKAVAVKLEAVDFAHWRFHDLRHTLITRMRNGEENEEGETTFAIPLDVVQQVVNHEITAGVTSVYDHGDIEKRYRLRKRDALEWWGRKLMAIVGQDQNSENVITLHKA